MLGIVGVVLLVAVAIGFGVAALRSVAGEVTLTSPGVVPEEERPAPAPRDAEDPIPVPELGDLEGADAELGGILRDIDRSEQQMLATQERIGELLAAAALEPGAADCGALVDELVAAAGDGQAALQELRSDLASAPASSSAIREVRDVYLDHLDAWVRYFVAIEADPMLLAGGGSDESFLLAINTSGDAFARAVRQGLPDDLDPEVQAYADAIVDRGFPERELSTDDTV